MSISFLPIPSASSPHCHPFSFFPTPPPLHPWPSTHVPPPSRFSSDAAIPSSVVTARASPPSPEPLRNSHRDATASPNSHSNAALLLCHTFASLLCHSSAHDVADPLKTQPSPQIRSRRSPRRRSARDAAPTADPLATQPRRIAARDVAPSAAPPPSRSYPFQPPPPVHPLFSTAGCCCQFYSWVQCLGGEF